MRELLAVQEDLEGDSREFAVAMAKIAHETKGEDILVLHVAPLVYWTSYMVPLSVPVLSLLGRQ